jgi:hypothetical protein
VTTIQGETVQVGVGQWIVPEKQPGRFYPIAPDVFAETYEEIKPVDGNPKPSVCAMVHYVGHDEACRAAVVTEVDGAEPWRVGLFVMHPAEQAYRSLAAGGVRNDETEHQVNTWHWPERVG